VPHISPLDDRLVLDVGCGNGYHCWRMAEAGARRVVGIDPTALFLAQFLAVRRLMQPMAARLVERVWMLPLGIEAMPSALGRFDTVFSMGVLYHRRSPIDHLLELRGALRPGGQLVLETLVVDGDASRTLVPEGRYAKMRNVWFIPSTAMLENWLRRCGYRDIRTVDVTPTTIAEQRSTEWMTFESLADFLDPADTRLTIEGHPAPQRAVLVAGT
jgi:tRNA (mo5U34)-methyltransferase